MAFTNTEGGLVNELFDLNMGLFNRRDFLKKSGQGLGLIAASLTAPGMVFAHASIPRSNILEKLRKEQYSPKELKITKKFAERFGNVLPPGFANCRDSVLSCIYGEKFCGAKFFEKGSGIERDRRKQIHVGYDILDRLWSNIGIKGKQVNWQSRYIEPAFYFTLMKMSNKPYTGHIASDIIDINPALGFLEYGFNMYAARWILDDTFFVRPKDEKVETALLNSIFCAGYGSVPFAQSKTAEFTQATPVHQARMLDELMNKQFDKMSKDSKSCDPNDGYNRCLVASWASFMLVNHYWMASEKENDSNYNLLKTINNSIEKPLRKYALNLRDGPKYINSKI